jgi:hypothetical protein
MDRLKKCYVQKLKDFLGPYFTVQVYPSVSFSNTRAVRVVFPTKPRSHISISCPNCVQPKAVVLSVQVHT